MPILHRGSTGAVVSSLQHIMSAAPQCHQRLDRRPLTRFALGSSAFAGQGAILEYELTLTGLQPVYETAAGGIAFKLPFCTIRVSGLWVTHGVGRNLGLRPSDR